MRDELDAYPLARGNCLLSLLSEAMLNKPVRPKPNYQARMRTELFVQRRMENIPYAIAPERQRSWPDDATSCGGRLGVEYGATGGTSIGIRTNRTLADRGTCSPGKCAMALPPSMMDVGAVGKVSHRP